MLFDGKKSAESLLSSLAKKSDEYKHLYGRTPCLCVLIVGNDYGSQRYVASCEKNAIKAGLTCQVIRMDENSTEEQVITTVQQLNTNDNIDGILIQMPLPKHINQQHVIQSLNPEKDVDGITDANVAKLWKSRKNDYTQFCVPCTPRSVMRILKETNTELDGKKVVVIGRSNIVGLPVSKLIMNENATITIAHSHTHNLPQLLQQADIIVAAIGKPKYITADMVSPHSTIIDVGINADPQTGKMCGDIDTEAVKDKCDMITPVPGGVGPLTICSLMENTIDCFTRKYIHQ